MFRWVFLIGALLSFAFFNAEAQNTSNKGKEFWIAYTGHVDGLESRMYLYVTSDVNTTAVVKIGGLSIAGSPFTITANTIQAIPIDPASAYVGTSDVTVTGKAIEVVADQPVVVYAHIFKAARSAATLVLPTKVLGREYYTAAFIQNKLGGNGAGPCYSEFTIIAVEDNTIVEITPKAKDIGGSHAAGVTFQKTLKKGEIYQYQSETDLSASHILSVADASGVCKPIAVFSGSSWVGFCGDNVASGSGGDNLYQQLYPVTAWGKEFITAPFIRKPYDVFRVYFSKDNTTLTLNGSTKGVFNKGAFFEFTASEGNNIKANEPISVVQYQISQGCDPANAGFNNTTAPHPGDPEMTILNPVEQTLSKITVYSALQSQTTPPTNIKEHYINIIIKDEFKASFTINGLAPQGNFVPITGTGYSYLQEDVTARSVTNPTHTLMADGGFSAIAYGYGSVESYGYLAGADAKNLYENLQIFDANTRVQKSDVCVGETAAFTLVLPYIPLRLTWTVDGVPETPIDNPVPDGTEIINGVTVYKFNYSRNIPFTAPGVHQVKISAIDPNPSGCDPNQEIVSDFEAFALPSPKFSSNTTQTCAGSAITFTDESSANGKNISKWYWNFGDGNTIIKRSAAPFEYTYVNPGTFPVTLYVESEAGCSSSTTDAVDIHVNKMPDAAFKFTTPSCETREITFTDQSVANEGSIVKWNWNFGDINAGAGNANVSTAQHPVHTFSTPGTYSVTLVVETDKGCTSVAVKHDVVINGLPKSDFETPDACVNDVAVIFKNTSVNGITGLSYVWDFDDPASGALNSSTSLDGAHKYTSAGNYNVKLTVITPEGCSFTTAKTFRVNGATPTAAFQLLNAGNLCSNKDILVKDNSSIAGFDQITRIEWYLDGVKVAEKLRPVKGDNYALVYPVFHSPITKPAKLKLIAYSGAVDGPCQSISEQDIILHAAPLVNFDVVSPICVNAGKVQFTAELTGDATGIGVFSGKGISRDGLFDPQSAGTGTWNITYTYTGDNGCVDVKSQPVIVNPVPMVNIDKDIYAFIDGVVQVNATVTESGLRFKWSPSTGLNRTDVLNPVITVDDDRVYTLTVTSSLNCDETVFVRLHALREINPPNAFSPNNDGVNDVWKLNYLESYPKATVGVFNRYGERVFFSQGYVIPFDGNYNGQPLPAGTYYYIIDPKNGKKIITGPLTIIR